MYSHFSFVNPNINFRQHCEYNSADQEGVSGNISQIIGMSSCYWHHLHILCYLHLFSQVCHFLLTMPSFCAIFTWLVRFVIINYVNILFIVHLLTSEIFFQNSKFAWGRILEADRTCIFVHNSSRKLCSSDLNVPHSIHQVKCWQILQKAFLFNPLTFISVERYIGICYPIQSRTLGTRHLLYYLLPVLLFRKNHQTINFYPSHWAHWQFGDISFVLETKIVWWWPQFNIQHS